MNKTHCSREKEILVAAGNGFLDSSQDDHLKTCLFCREALAVRSWMGDFSGIPSRIESEPVKIPDFETVWQGAKAYRKYDREIEKKVLRPLVIPQILTFLAALIGIISVISSDFNQIRIIVSDKLKMGYLFDLLTFMGKKMLALVPFMIIPLIVIGFFIALHFLYSLFNPKKI